MKKNNVIWHHSKVTRDMREIQNRHKSFILWFIGLPASGKSTLAHEVENRLHQMGCKTFVFDGDNVRHGLNKDLGFSKENRKENLRRIGEMCKLFIEAGVIAFAAFISPYREDRDMVRKLVGDGEFVEIYCDCSPEVCESRDIKGNYAKAKRGEIPEFTGISAPYEKPENPEMILDTANISVEDNVKRVLEYLKERNLLI
jgi:adenylylsulfate kinase